MKTIGGWLILLGLVLIGFAILFQFLANWPFLGSLFGWGGVICLIPGVVLRIWSIEPGVGEE
jgi:hypothetical protein